MRGVWMVMLLGACPSGPAAGPPNAAADLQAPAPGPTAIAVPLGSLDRPYQVDDAAPVLDGDRSALDLKSLTRTQLDYGLNLDTRALSDLGPDQITALRLQLAADPRWRVHEVDEVWVATRRAQDEHGWTVPSGGYHADAAGPWRVALRMGAWPSTSPWASSDLVCRISAGASEAHLPGFVPGNSVWEGLITTALSVDGPRVGLDVYEVGHPDTRERTAAALEEVPSLVHNIGVMGDRVRRAGHEPMLLPSGEPTITTPSLVLTSPGPGELEWRGRFNPGEAGWVWLRLVQGKGAWEDVAVAGGSREAIGWSTDPARTFYAQGRFGVPRGEAFLARAEVWFLPERGDARRLLQQDVQVPVR